VCRQCPAVQPATSPRTRPGRGSRPVLGSRAGQAHPPAQTKCTNNKTSTSTGIIGTNTAPTTRATKTPIGNRQGNRHQPQQGGVPGARGCGCQRARLEFTHKDHKHIRTRTRTVTHTHTQSHTHTHIPSLQCPPQQDPAGPRGPPSPSGQAGRSETRQGPPHT
jgi:hypothetical protein